MGKRIVIKGANFSANKIVQQPYVELTTTTAQGMIVASPYINESQTGSENFGYLGANQSNSTWLYGNYVHSNTSITLHPGDTIAIVERPNITTRAFICAYSTNGIKSIYPTLICSGSKQQIGTLIAGRESFATKFPNALNSSLLPRTLKNDGSSDWYIVLQLNNGGHTITASDTESAYYIGEIKYRIYTDNPTQYDPEWAPEVHPGTIDPDEEETDPENSGIWDDEDNNNTENNGGE